MGKGTRDGVCSIRTPKIASRYRESLRRESLIAVLPATTSDTFSGMQLKERPGPPGPYAAPDEIAPPRPDVSTGGTRYADIEYARDMGFRPLRMDLLLPPACWVPKLASCLQIVNFPRCVPSFGCDD